MCPGDPAHDNNLIQSAKIFTQSADKKKDKLTIVPTLYVAAGPIEW